MELFPNGSEVEVFDPQADGSAFRRAHGMEGMFVALYAGAHGLSNDLGIVLDAAHLLRDESHIAIVLLGDGKDKPALMAHAAEMELLNVRFIPPIPKTEMPQALDASDACIAILMAIATDATVLHT